MNRKVGHAHTMVIYSMDGLGGMEFPLTRYGTPVLHNNTTCTCLIYYVFYILHIFVLHINCDVSLLRMSFVMHNMGLDTRKPVFGGLQTTKVQPSLHIGKV